MNDSELMQVLYRLSNLIRQLLYTLLSQLKAALLDVVKHIFSGHKI
jgi:hypothetical protein